MISNTQAVKCTLFWPYSEDVPSSAVIILSPVSSFCLAVMSQLDVVQESLSDHGSYAGVILGARGPTGKSTKGTRSSGDAGPSCLFVDTNFKKEKCLQPSALVLSYWRSVLVSRLVSRPLYKRSWSRSWSQSGDFWSRPANAAMTDN